MANSYFSFKQFTVQQDRSAMKVSTDACLLGALATRLERDRLIRLDLAEEKKLRLLDIGAGTGLLSLMAAQELPYAVTAVEQDPGAAEQAAENFRASSWSDRLFLCPGDILQFPERDPFDVLICNPPFYERELQGPLAGRNAAHHGTALRWSDLFPKMRRLLKRDGRYYLLLPWKRREEGLQLLALAGLPAPGVTEVFPVEAKPPTRVIFSGSSGHGEGREHQSDEWGRIVIKDILGRYTPAFIELLRPFYLFL